MEGRQASADRRISERCLTSVHQPVIGHRSRQSPKTYHGWPTVPAAIAMNSKFPRGCRHQAISRCLDRIATKLVRSAAPATPAGCPSSDDHSAPLWCTTGQTRFQASGTYTISSVPGRSDPTDVKRRALRPFARSGSRLNRSASKPACYEVGMPVWLPIPNTNEPAEKSRANDRLQTESKDDHPVRHPAAQSTWRKHPVTVARTRHPGSP
jgi:hypothetical protein